MCGISTEDLPHVFERFYRGDKSRNQNEPGTGLGLAIARQIVLLHGGEIGVENRTAGGTTVSILLPVGS